MHRETLLLLILSASGAFADQVYEVLGTRINGSRTVLKRAIVNNPVGDCPGPPPIPKNSNLKCYSASCIATCQGNAKFNFGRNKGNKLVIICKNKQWRPLTDQLRKIIDCESNCNPPCKKGRTCFENNHCGCPDNFGGPQCDQPQTCPEGQTYKTCGDKCTETCRGLSKACTTSCVEGCVCGEGRTKNSKGECVPIDKCPCLVNGKEVEDGYSEVKKIGAQYEIWSCKNQQFTSKPITKGRCHMWGDPHYTSIDGKKFDFQGRCTYRLLEHKNFTIFGENVGCKGIGNGKIQFFDKDKTMPTCTKSISIHVPQMKAHLLQNKEVIVNGRKVSQYPFHMFNVRLTLTAMHVIAQFADGVEIQWDGISTASITVPEFYYGEVSGLLGTFNNNPEDDFTKSDGSLTTSVEEFGNSWKEDESCRDVKKVKHPCDASPDKRKKAEEVCAAIKSEQFKPCHGKVAADAFYDDCVYDTCQSNDDEKQSSCTVFAAYARQCLLEGVTLDWRSKVQHCAIKCPAGQVYQLCGPSCGNTCKDLVLNPTCSSSCVEGCSCPNGQTLDNVGKCVPKSQCGCAQDGIEYPHGKVLIRPLAGSEAEKCTCSNAKWTCAKQPPTTCDAYGDPHYKTFDNRRFDFMGPSSYYLVKDKDFIIEGRNEKCGGHVTCTLSLTIRMNRIKIGLLRGKVLQVNDKAVKVPWEDRGMRVYAASSAEMIAALPNGVQVKWDGQYKWSITLPGIFYDRVKGLCGTYNGNPNDDFTTSQGAVVNDPNTFGHSWVTNDEALEPEFLQHPCEGNAELRTKAEELCKYIKEPLFAKCHGVANPDAYYENCRVDVCACLDKDRSKCSCPVIAAYSDVCANKFVLVEWRAKVESCMMPCPQGQVYQACGNTCERSCRDIGVSICTKECIEGCNCPVGQALDENNKCIPRDQCPCMHNDIRYKRGQQISKITDDNKVERCSCLGPLWQCQAQHSATCSAVNDRHYTTFDGKKYDFMGNCAYYLVKHAAFSVIAQNSALGSASNSKPVVVKIRTIIIQLERDLNQVTIGGKPIKTFPIQEDGYTITKASSSQLLVTLWNSVIIKWDGVSVVHVSIPGTLFDETEGLCGTFNGKIEDDTLTSNGKVVTDVQEFGTSWAADEDCDMMKTEPIVHPCEQDPKKKPRAEALCKKLRNNVFTACHGKADVEQAFASCVLDICAAGKGEEDAAVCRSLSTYAQECQQNAGVTVNWRASVPECGVQCSGGQKFYACGNPCVRTCRDIPNRPRCIAKCVEGCNCPDGQTLDSNGKCIPMAKCPCYNRGQEYAADTTLLRAKPKGGMELCTCIDANWVCMDQKGARCTILEDKHYTTFDLHKYDVDDACSFVLLTRDALTIKSEQRKCANEKEKTACFKALTINDGVVSVTLDKNKNIVFNGVNIIGLPYEQRGVRIRAASDNFIVVKLASGVEIWSDGTSRTYIDVSAQFFERTKGLCGTFNGDPTDDYTTKQGEVVNKASEFASSWKAKENCAENVAYDPCNADASMKKEADSYCKHLKAKLFAECHAQIPVDAFYENCMYDVCECKGSPHCVCPVYSVYADECAALGVFVEWRKVVKQCEIQCPFGKEYQLCGDSCKRSCKDLQSGAQCQTKCVEGCNCPEGKTLDDDGNCITLEQCTCVFENKNYQHGSRIVRKNARVMELCVCEEGAWTCDKQKSGHCVSVGTHVTTFDGRKVDIDKSCRYYLYKQDDFSVVTSLGECKDKVCKTKILIESNSDSIILLEGETTVLYNGQKLSVPINKKTLSMYMESSVSLLVKFLVSGIEVRWDRGSKVSLNVPSTYYGKTQGLCGIFNNDPSDDLTQRDGSLTDDVKSFAGSWQVEPKCKVIKEIENKCDANDKLLPKAESNCNILHNRMFVPCHNLIEVDAFYEMCVTDSCTCIETGDCVCQILSLYADECAAKGLSIDWRKLVPQCGVKCPKGQVYTACADTCSHSCQAIAIGGDTCDAAGKCVEGCQCPDGQSEDKNGKCVPSGDCPCIHEYKEHAAGSKITTRATEDQPMQHCTCKGGRWDCTAAKYGRCTNIGLPHYTTFDGKAYHFKANCKYYLIRTEVLAVEAELHACSQTKKNAVLGDAASSSPTCAKSVTIKAGNVVIELGQDEKIIADGKPITNFPVNIRNVNIRKATSKTVIVQLKNGVEVWWDGDTKVKIEVPPELEGKTQGLCGTFNGNLDDEFTTSNGDVTDDIQKFVDSWKIATCDDKPDFGNPCDRDPSKKKQAEAKCAVLKQQPFQACHQVVGYQEYFDICMYELCSCDLKIKCMCDLIKDYVETCAAESVLLEWTNVLSECAEQCPAGQEYSACADSCTRSCEDLSSAPTCSTKCVQGCACPAGHTLDKQAKCVPMLECACVHKGKQYNKGQQVLRKSQTKGRASLEQCLCNDGLWDCQPASLDDLLAVLEMYGIA